MSIADTFESRKNDPRWNTSYPLSPTDWAQYRVDKPLSFDNDKELSFYIHIPFCKQLCSFCEYTRMICPDEREQFGYLHAVDSDVSSFVARHPDIRLRGFDVGGGTPTALSEANFDYLLQIYFDAISCLELSDDYEPSIEGTFNTLTERKIESIVKRGIRRLSLGIQSTDSSILCSHQREYNDIAAMAKWMHMAWAKGIEKINLDLMYGLMGQSLASIDADLYTIQHLKPQQVTLYELRTNMIAVKDIPSKDILFQQYRHYYDGLLALGYKADFGANTFSLDEHDKGVSSYLRSRMFEAIPYKGFGISAQSMSSEGVSYNVGKNSNGIRSLLSQETFQEEYTYLLPPDELAAKRVAIAAYNGYLNMDFFDKCDKGKKEEIIEALKFCLDNNLLSRMGNSSYRITSVGFKYYGAVFSLFIKHQQRKTTVKAYPIGQMRKI